MKTEVGVAPDSKGPIGVLLTGHNDAGEIISVGAYGPDVFWAIDTAIDWLTHLTWDFSFCTDDYTVYRFPSRIPSPHSGLDPQIGD